MLREVHVVSFGERTVQLDILVVYMYTCVLILMGTISLFLYLLNILSRQYDIVIDITRIDILIVWKHVVNDNDEAAFLSFYVSLTALQKIGIVKIFYQQKYL